MGLLIQIAIVVQHLQLLIGKRNLLLEFGTSPHFGLDLLHQRVVAFLEEEGLMVDIADFLIGVDGYSLDQLTNVLGPHCVMLPQLLVFLQQSLRQLVQFRHFSLDLRPLLLEVLVLFLDGVDQRHDVLNGQLEPIFWRLRRILSQRCVVGICIMG